MNSREREGGREEWATFIGEASGLRADADAAAVVLVLRWPAQVVPHTLGAHAAQVGAVRLDALLHSLLLGNATHTYKDITYTALVDA